MPNFVASSTTSLNRSSSAGSLGLICCVRQCTVKLLIPVSQIFLTSSSVGSRSGNRRIFAETGTSTLSTSPRRIEHSRSGSESKAAPIPPFNEKSFGQPQFKSMPLTSACTSFAAATASSGEADPIWKIKRDFSMGWHSNIDRPDFGWMNEMVPEAAVNTTKVSADDIAACIAATYGPQSVDSRLSPCQQFLDLRVAL